MRLLVISDIHNKYVRAQSILDSVEHDRVVFLGDYFDSFGDTVADAHVTALWLKENVLHNPKAVPLIGNHDAQYIWNTNEHLRCSGFSVEKNAEITKLLSPEDKSKFKLFHVDQGFVFSHAGLSNQQWHEILLRYPEPDGAPTLEFFNEVLTVVARNAVEDICAGKDTRLLAAGWDRGGLCRHGGINWVDWRNFSPINGINQIVGHTPQRIPSVITQKVGGAIWSGPVTEYYKKEVRGDELLSIAYDLDTALTHYAVIEDGAVSFIEYFNRINLRDVPKYAIPENSLSPLT